MPQGVPTTVPDDGLTTRERRNRPLIMVHTGPGKGKSTAAFGLAMRGWNQGFSIGVFQFVKSAKWRIGEQTVLERLGELHEETGEGGPVAWHKMGSGWSWSRKAGTEEDHAADAAEGWQEIKRALAEERHDLYVLDEFTYPMKWGWVDVDDVVSTLVEPARPAARRHHRPPRRPAPGRGRQPRHRDGPGQAPDGGRAEGPARHRMVTLPRLMVAAPASGHGKTTVATGLMAALARAGHTVSGHKVGPDYIDPGYHALATGRPGRNLDPHLVGEERLVPLLLHGAAGADLAVIEGVMGLYDGQIGGDGFASTAHVAAVTRTPVVLVVDISSASRTIAATIHGLMTWAQPPVDVVGVILNKAGSARHADEVVRSIGDQVPVLGILQRDDGIEAPSRHLGLVPAAERGGCGGGARPAGRRRSRRRWTWRRSYGWRRRRRSWTRCPGIPRRSAGRRSALPGVHRRPLRWLSVGSVATVSTRPVVRDVRPSSTSGGPSGRRPASRSLAGGRSRSATPRPSSCWQAAGAEVVDLDPLTDTELPEGTTGLYLGGGFPEMHAADLGANERLRARHPRRAIARGLPTVAECAGLLYLCRVGRRAVRTGRRPWSARSDATPQMAPRLTLSYRTRHRRRRRPAVPRRASRSPGTSSTAPTSIGDPGGQPAWWLDEPDRPAGVATRTLHASYLHVHWAGHPHLAARFVEAASRGAGDAPR